MRKFSILLAGSALLVFAQSAMKLHYPLPPVMDQVDDYHGTKLDDPYRTLENADAEATRKWVDAENELTHSYLDRIPGRDVIKSRLTDLWNYEKFGGLTHAGSHFFYLHNTGLQNQSVLFVENSLTGTPRVLLDPNTYRTDGTVALNGHRASWNGKLLAYGIAQAGSDWTEWHVRDVETGQDRPDLVQWTKAGGIAWARNDQGFYYSRYPEPPQEKLLTVSAEHSTVYFHRLGDAQAQDKMVYERPDQPSWGLYADVSEGGDYLLIAIEPNIPGKNLLSYIDLKSTQPAVVDLISKVEHAYQPIDFVDSLLYLQTDDGAPLGRIVAIDIHHPERAHWREIVPEQKETLETVQMVDGKLLLSYMKDAHSTLRLATLEGKPLQDIDLPGIGTAGVSPARLHDKQVFYSFASFAVPPTYYRLDLENGKSTTIHQSKVAFDPSQFETIQVFYPSKDGTRVPMFLTYRKGMEPNGQNPTLLYAYGGFDIPITPNFNPALVEWMQMGGIYAVANIRGGSEYGEAWHQAGMLAHKQNVFDDFISAGEWLIAKHYTSTSKLAIFGGSNGGLLVGAVLNQRPDLFGAAMPAVGVMDMLRFQKFGFGNSWTGEYGSAENAADFPVLRAYSPLHNIKRGTEYPPTLVTTSDHDDRVMPGHSLKYAATLQQAQEGPAPILIRIETRAGHGAGKPTSKQIDEWVDRFAFLESALKITPQKPHPDM